MEQHYHFNIDPKEPSRAQIERHMDFDALLREASGDDAASIPPVGARIRPLRTRRLGYTIGAVAAVALLVLVAWPWLRSANPAAPSAEQYFAAQPYVAAPIPTVAADYIAGTVASDQETILDYPSGSRLVIPAFAFQDDRGNAVDGAVEVKFRELYDQVDFFVAGIPMRYDSASQTYQLASAGMIDVYAEQNGRRVYLQRDKEIQVSFASYVVAGAGGLLPQLHVYQLDTALRNWQYSQPDQLMLLDTEADLLARQSVPALRGPAEVEANYQWELAALEARIPEPVAPNKPERSRSQSTTLNLDFLNGLQLANGSDVDPADMDRINPNGIWEIAPESPPIDTRAFSVVWEQVRLERRSDDRYQLTLINTQKSESMIVRPALLGAAYDQALANYEQDLAAYQRVKAERDRQLAAERQALTEKWEDKRAAAQAALNNYLAALSPTERQQIMRRRVLHRFSVRQLGIYNCARPIQPDLQSLRVRYEDAAGNEINNRTAYVINAEDNTVYRYLAADGADLSLRSSADNVLWIVKENGELVVADAATLRQLKPKGVQTIKLKSSVSDPNDISAVRNALGIVR